MATAVERWIEQLWTTYDGESGDDLVKRLVGWQGTGDVAVTNFLILRELRLIREALTAQDRRAKQ